MQKRHPVRLIIAMMPENIYERRIRQKNKENKSTGYNTLMNIKKEHISICLSAIYPNANLIVMQFVSCTGLDGKSNLFL
jgi:hypothetical protein